MNANIFKHEFRSRVKSVLIWSLSIAALIFTFSTFFSGFADDAALVNEMMAKFPPEMKAAFALDKMDFSTVLGYFSLLFLFAQLCIAIQASNYGFGLVSIEESELTADFLLSKPVSRAGVLTSKFLAALACLTITNLATWAVTFTAIEMFRGERTYDAKTLLLLLGSIILFQLFFLCLGLVISLLVKRVRSVTPYGLGLGFGMYVLSAFSGVLGDVKLEYLTPFKHFDATAIVHDAAYNTPLVLLNVAVTVISMAVSYWLYVRRDIPAVS